LTSHKIEHRTKSVESFLHKLQTKKYADPFQDIKDFVGLRIVTYYPDDVSRIADLLKDEFVIDKEHSRDEFAQLNVDEFGYRSIHLVVRLKKPRTSLPEWNAFLSLCAEIQIRSVLQHAWASISHKLDYKTAAQAPPELRRQLFRLSALLELADQEFRSLREDIHEIKKRYSREVHRGDLNIPLSLDSLSEFVEQRVDLNKWAQLGVQSGMSAVSKIVDLSGDLPPLLLTLQAAGVSSVAEFAKMLPKIRRQAKQHLAEFRGAMHSVNRVFYAEPVDVITIVVSMTLADKLPRDFDWGETYIRPARTALRRACGLQVVRKPREKKRGSK
jgi:putative GTP pyrophosphokinase